MGSSAGGHLAATLATSGGVSTFTIGHETADLEGTIGGNLEFSSRVQAAVDAFYDWQGGLVWLRLDYGLEADRIRRLVAEELAAESEFDVTVVNTEVHAASEELVALIKNVPTHP